MVLKVSGKFFYYLSLICVIVKFLIGKMGSTQGFYASPVPKLNRKCHNLSRNFQQKNQNITRQPPIIKITIYNVQILHKPNNYLSYYYLIISTWYNFTPSNFTIRLLKVSSMNECSFSPRSIILGQMATACQPHIRIKVGPGDSRIDNLPLSKDCVIAAFGFSPGKFVLLPQLQNVQCDHNDCCCLDCEEQQSSERRDFLYVCFPNRG